MVATTADGVEFTLGMTVYMREELGFAELATSPATHKLVKIAHYGGVHYCIGRSEDFTIDLKCYWSTRAKAIEHAIAVREKKIAQLNAEIDQLYAVYTQ